MGAFDKIEKRIEGAVSSVFARAFKGEVQPVEIAARLQRELDSEAKILARDKRLVPNEFVVGLSNHDYERLTPYSKTLNSEIIPELREHANDNGYVFNGPITIRYVREKSLPTGRFTVTSEAVAAHDDPRENEQDQIRKAGLVLEVNGVRHPLVAPGLVIGRGTEADLRINDPGISRRHAQISVIGQGSGKTIEIVDLGSTNGIIVDGIKVDHATLKSGSRIEIGTTRLLVHSPMAE
ncbi:MAG: FhaA domain-containing protein [Propionibacteriaceae bacterium]